MASGNFMGVFTPLSATFPASAFATLDLRNNHPVLDFDGSTDEEAYFEGTLPAHYAGGGLTVTVHVAFSSATSGTSRWQASIERMNTDLDADSFPSFQSQTLAANGTSGITTSAAIAFTSGAQMDSLAASENYRLVIHRDADGTSGTDDIATDAELVRVVITET